MAATAEAGESAFAFLAQGAILQEFRVAGHNIVQSFPTPDLYREAPFFGETIGRTTNRIKGAIIDDLNGRSYHLSANNGPNHLHGGDQGWGRRVFVGPEMVDRKGKKATQFTYVSPDGDEGYPGTVQVWVWYTPSNVVENGVPKVVLEAEYEVEMIGQECEETTVGVTNHSYFNLGDSPTVKGTQLTLTTSKHLPVDPTGIPTGTIEDFPGIEAGQMFTLGETEPFIDHCFIADTDPSNVPVDTRDLPLRKLASLHHPSTGLHLEISSTEPAFQIYTGDYVDVPAADNSPARPPRAGVCVEPSRYINAINIPPWRDMAVVRRGQKWGARNVYVAWKA